MFGATSMVGSHFAERHPEITAAGRSDPAKHGLRRAEFRPLDLTDLARVEAVVRDGPEEVVVNFAARTDVDGIEGERSPTPEQSPAWMINAGVPHALARACHVRGKQFIQVSTNFVFDGRDGPYREEAPRSPLTPGLSWYGWTKSEGERLALEAEPATTILRLAFPYRSGFPLKADFARWILRQSREGTLPPMYRDQQLTPTWIPDVTRTVEQVIREPIPGVVHCVSPDFTTPFEFAEEVRRCAGGHGPAVTESWLSDAPAAPGKAVRPIRAGLIASALPKRGVALTPWREGIRQMVDSEPGR